MDSLKNKPWWVYLEHDLQELLTQSLTLIKTVEKWKRDPSTSPGQEFHDYAFIVFPAAKAYEGFLKKLFLDMGFISEKQYYGKRFRVGKALNPALERRIRERESVYDKIVGYCDGSELGDFLWETWKQCRNLLFHWFPKERNAISFDGAKKRVFMIVDAIDRAFKQCEVDIK